MGLIEFSPAACSHALDLSEAAVDSVALVFYLRGVESIAGHQAVSLAIQILQTILWGRQRWSVDVTGTLDDVNVFSYLTSMSYSLPLVLGLKYRSLRCS